MCFNAEVSLNMYILGTVGYINLYLKGFKAEAMLYACVIQMQLIEYFLWKSQQNDENNRLMTKLGILINHLEPIIFWLGIKYYGLELPKWLDIMMLSYIIYSIIYTKSAWKSLTTTHVSKESKPHLHWKWNEGEGHDLFYAYFLLVLYLLSVYGLKNGSVHGMFVLLSFAISYIIYGNKHSVGAMWCFIAALGPWLIPLFYKNHQNGCEYM